MSEAERRKHPRLKSSARILWAVVGNDFLQLDRLIDVSSSGALVATESVASVGAEIRFELLDDDGEKFATGLGRVAWTNAIKGMGISFLALGVDPSIITDLAATAGATGRPKAPPRLPGAAKAAPPFPGAGAEKAASKLEEDLAREIQAPAAVEEDDEPAPEIEPLSVKKPGIVIGIDLGTTNTCVSYVAEGRPQIIPGRTGTSTIPSMITFDPDGSFYIGQRAADRHVMYPLRTVYGSKRLLGRTYRHDLAAELQQHFAFPLGEAEGQRFGLQLEDRVISMDDVAIRVLEEVRSTAEAHLGQKVEGAVITVPAHFSEVQRDAVRRAADGANLAVHRVVNEPTAAAVAYGHKRTQNRRIAVWDFGGGTFDFSIVDVADGQFEVVASDGDNFLGGSDFDDLVASHVLGVFQGMAGLSFDPDPQQIARLREACELAKRSLTVQDDHLIELPDFTSEPRHTLSVELTRDTFEAISWPLVARTLALATEVMDAAGVEPTEVDDVVLVGGSSRIPAVQVGVEALFGQRPSKRVNPDEAVALGAALLADEIGSHDAPTLLDILPMSVGFGKTGQRFEALVPRNSRLPVEKSVTVDADLLGCATLPIFQGESPDVSENEYICSATVEDRSLFDKGRVAFRLSFDEHCVMAVDARHARSGKALPVKLERSRPIEDVLKDLGEYFGPEAETWRLPESRLGKVMGKLFSLFGRR